jgi:GNAT superfamily N-acetyltransferase
MMRAAVAHDRKAVTDILIASFDGNPAVNDTVVPDAYRPERLRALMHYIFDTGFARKGVFINHERTGAAVLYDPLAFPNTIADTWRQVKLVHRCIGWGRVRYASAKDKRIASFRPATPHLYLQMIGTIPAAQGKGVGSAMIAFIQEEARRAKRPVYLETSVDKNVELYLRKGFEIHGEWKIRAGYHVRFMNWRPE